MTHGDAAVAFAALLRIPDDAIELVRFRQTFNVRAERCAALCDAARAVVLGHARPVAIHPDRVSALEERIIVRLRELHRTTPPSPGLGLDMLRNELAPWLAQEAFGDAIRSLASRRKVVLANSLVKAADRGSEFSAAESDLWERIWPVLVAGAATPPGVEPLAATLRVKIPVAYRKGAPRA